VQGRQAGKDRNTVQGMQGNECRGRQARRQSKAGRQGKERSARHCRVTNAGEGRHGGKAREAGRAKQAGSVRLEGLATQAVQGKSDRAGQGKQGRVWHE
jgi:hypothetical protein